MICANPKCGKEFEVGIRGQAKKFCSELCGDRTRGRAYYHRTKTNVPLSIGACIQCGEEFQGAGSWTHRKKYCSRKCQQKFNNKRRYRPIKTLFFKKCPTCKAPFSTTVPRQKCCSKSCYGKLWAKLHPSHAREYHKTAKRKKWELENYNKMRTYAKAYAKRYVDTLADNYVVQNLKKRGFNAPTPELIEIKRKNITLKRKIYEIKQAAQVTG